MAGETYNPTTGNIESAGAGTVEPQVDLLGPGGTPRTVPQSQRDFFISSGYQLDTPQARQEIELQHKYGEGTGNELAAGALGAGRTLSFGLSDLALQRSGLVSSEALRELKNRNPDATTAGELGALLLPLGGQALGAIKGAGMLGGLARGAGAVAEGSGAGLSLLSKLGEGVAKAATKATGSQVIGRAASDAAQALAFHIGQNLSETVLGDQDVTAERLLAHSGQALAVGAGLGLGLPLATKGVMIAAGKAKEAISALGTALKERVLPAASDAAAGVYSKAYGAATGGGEKAADEIYAMLEGGFKAAPAKEREALLSAISPEQRDQLHGEIFSLIDQAHQNAEAMSRAAFREFRPKEISKLLEGVDVQPALADAGRLVGVVRDTAKRMADDPLLYDQTYRRELEHMADGLEEKLTGGSVNTADELFKSVDKIKGTAVADLSKFNKNLSSRATENAAGLIKRDVYGAFKAHLEDASIYGDAAARQSAFNDAISSYIDSTGKKGAFRRFFMGPSGGVEVEKVNRFLNRTGAVRDRDMADALNEFVASSSSLAEQVQKSAQTVGGDIDRKGFESILGKVVDLHKKAAEDLAFTSKVRAQDAFGMALLNFQRSVGDTLFRDGVFSATLKLAQRAANPFTVAKTLSNAEGIVLRGSERASAAIGKAVDAMASAGGKVAQVARPYAEPVSLNILLHAVIGDDAGKGDKPKNRQDGYRRAIKRLAELTADPNTSAQQYGDGVSHLAKAAPNLSQSLVGTQMRGLQFINDKAPRDPSAGMTLQPNKEDYHPTDSDLSKWERYIAAVADPYSVLDELRHGSVSPEAVEAVQAVYPNLYQDIRLQLTQKVSELEATVPYHDRMQLSQLFGVPLDPTLDSGFVNAIQNSYAQATQAQASRPAIRPSAAAQKLGTLEETPAQRIENR